jgi:hypothetical protein
LADRGEFVKAGVREYDVKFTKLLYCGRDGALSCLDIGHISLNGHDVITKFRCRCAQGLVVTSGYSNPSAFSYEKSCCGQADTAVAASNQRRFISKSVRKVFL